MLKNSDFGLALLDRAASRTAPAIQEAETVEAVEVQNSNQFKFEVMEKPIFLGEGNQIQGYKALVRSDNEAVLNVCNDSYGLITNEQFCDFVFNLSQITGYEVASFSEFAGGRKVLAFLNAPETSLNGWQFKNYLAVGNSHDSTKALFVASTQVMIRCQNQFTSLSRGALKAYHTSGKDWKLANISRSIALYGEQQKIIQANYHEMLNRQRKDEEVGQFLGYLFDVDPREKRENVSTRKLNQISDFVTAMAVELNDVGFNDFGLFCSVTRYTTHVRNQKDKTFGNVFGSNADLNNKALRYFDYLN
jgi:hypothetical protein